MACKLYFLEGRSQVQLVQGPISPIVGFRSTKRAIAYDEHVKLLPYGEHANGKDVPRAIEHTADFDMCRSLIARIESSNTIESEALELAQSTNGTSAFKPLKIDDAREREHVNRVVNAIRG